MADRTTRFGRGSRRAVALAIAIGTVGCAGPDKNKPPFEMTQDLQSKLAAPVNKTAAPVPTASFDPTATGGQGVTAANSFGRLKPGAGTSAPGNFVAQLPPPQIGGAASASAPVQPGMAHAAAPLVPDSNRMTTPGRAPTTPIQQTGGTTSPPSNKLAPVMSEPPMTHATASQPLPPVSSTTPNLSVPIADPEPLPRPVPPQPPVGAAAPLPPVTSGNDGPGSGTLAPLPSATDSPPINGIKPPAPLKPADPVRPF